MERRFENSMKVTLTPASDTEPVTVKVPVTQCLCERDLTEADLVSFGISQAKASKFVVDINATMKAYNINTCLRKLHFLAQARHESADFRFQEEILPEKDKDKYEHRIDLGNVPGSGDGKRFKGRGFLQITGRNNYGKYSKYKQVDFLSEPTNTKLAELPYCIDSAGWYWSKFLGVDLNIYADKDDLCYCTYRINGGFNGFDDRRKKLHKMIALTICNTTNLISNKEYDIKDSEGCNQSRYVAKAKQRWNKMLDDKRKGKK